MKRALISGVMTLTALALAACGESASTPQTGGQAGKSASGGGAGSAAAAGASATSAGTSCSGAPAAAGASPGGGSAGSAAGSGAGGGGVAGGGAAPVAIPEDATVVIFMVDGLANMPLTTAVVEGASQLGYLVENGVLVDKVHSTSPAPRLELPGGVLPWGNATSGNVAVHTGCHLFESNEMDDIFLAARGAGIKSVFSGGDANYAPFTTPDFEYAGNLSDAVVVQNGINHVQNDGARLVRLHLQRIRDSWEGTASASDPGSAYVDHLLEIDALFGQLRTALEAADVWEKTYVILSSDHGMGTTNSSDHPPSALSSWQTVMVLYGPGIKRGQNIPYAELPDIAILTAHLLKLPALKGHTDPQVTLTQRGATGTLLSNAFEGAPAELAHPRYIERYLETGTYQAATGYSDYREGMLQLLE